MKHRDAMLQCCVRTTLNLDDDVAEAARELAHIERRPLGQVVSELARRGLVPRLDQSAKKGGFPVFCVEPGAPAITPRMVEDALDEP